MVLPAIDWEVVAEEIAIECDSALDVVEICESVEKATLKWLPEDLELCREMGGIEHEINESPGARRNYKGIIDLWYHQQDNLIKIVDWKTVKTLDGNWQRRQALSKQGCWYGLLLTAARLAKVTANPTFEVEYRGVHNPDGATLRTATQTLEMSDLIDFDSELSDWETWFNHLDRDWFKPWPKNQPEGCRPFGPRYPCSFEDVCEGRQDYKYVGEPPIKNFSHSMLGNLKRCPERLRLVTLTQITNPSPAAKSEASSFGSAFHAGIEEVYLQTLAKEH